MSKSPAFGNELRLVAIDLHKQQDVDDLIVQRKICGWNYSQEIIAKWRDSANRGLKTIFWIVLSDEVGTKAGHISLASRAEPHDPDLAKEDRSVMTISSFFILPERRSGGVGRKTMDLVEGMATKEPYGSTNCKAIAIDTLSSQYYDPSNSLWPILKDDLEKQPSNQLWYERRGYIPFKIEPRYQEDDHFGGITFDAVFMRKEL